MLKSLEMFGFKSFAERTKFDFSTGITCVVGPNGSGKSNVVDAIKWILGDQSPKSLRGKEMTDVIFNGAAGRKPSSFAEATLTFDNSKGFLPIDAQEVQIGRRIWRGGDSEYLINRNVARLKDVRDLFMGTGAATSAYSIIEQGKVAQILQANASARRGVFEEAAGISRFKARKIEALRKLDRVDQNLLRLTDIVDEIEAQLSSTRNQAAKAVKFQEVSDELRQCWLGLAADDFRHSSAKLEANETKLDELSLQIEELNQELSQYESQLAEFDREIARLDERLRRAEQLSATNRETIASHEATVRHQTHRREELESDLGRLRQQRSRTRSRMLETAAQRDEAQNRLDQFLTEFESQANQLQEREQSIQSLVSDIEESRTSINESRQCQITLMNSMSNSKNKIAALQLQLRSHESMSSRLESNGTELETKIEACQQEYRRREAGVDDVLAQMSSLDEKLNAIQNRRRNLASEQDESQRQIAEKREQRSALAERQRVLEDLEKRQEGWAIGVKEILNRAKTSGYEPWNSILGTVADLLDVDLHDAALIEVALDQRSQLIVVSELERLIEYLQQGSSRISGRVGFISLKDAELHTFSLPAANDSSTSEAAESDDPNEPEPTESVKTEDSSDESERFKHSDFVDLSDMTGVVCRADQRVRAPASAPLLGQLLLADTWIVHTLDDALRLAEETADCNYRFVTLQGELLDADGTLYAGTVRGETAVMSRKSELRRLKNDLSRLDRQIESSEQQLSSVDGDLAQIHQELAALDTEKHQLGTQLSKIKADFAAQEQELQRLQSERLRIDEELLQVANEQQDTQSNIEQEQEVQTIAADQLETVQETLDEAEDSLTGMEAKLREQQRLQTEEQLQWAKQEERLTALQNEMERFDGQQSQLDEQAAEADRGFNSAQQTQRSLNLQILNTSAVLSELAIAEERFQSTIKALLNEKEGQRQRKATIVETETTLRQQRRNLEDRRHQFEISVRDIRHQIAAIEERIQDEYQLTLAEVAESDASALADYIEERREKHRKKSKQPADQESEDEASVQADEFSEITFEEVRDELEARVNRLRRKIKLMGNVNADSLKDLQELEDRFNHMNSQLQDLTEAKSTLEEIVRKINTESRRLFLESFDAIRAQFQDLFRKLFGGGEGDVILEDPDDVLDCGIDIVARPPGKELRSITLLSGGEKTMTAVALLMSIFRSRPSPFCILDEVDAALDEANVERFSSIVAEFKDATQFIVITHRKRTMTVGDRLYGVTMEQSGISKRMSVRFDDVNENGDIISSEESRNAA